MWTAQRAHKRKLWASLHCPYREAHSETEEHITWQCRSWAHLRHAWQWDELIGKAKTIGLLMAPREWLVWLRTCAGMPTKCTKGHSKIKSKASWQSITQWHREWMSRTKNKESSEYPFDLLVGPLPGPTPLMPVMLKPIKPADWRWDEAFKQDLRAWLQAMQWIPEHHVSFMELSMDFELHVGKVLPLALQAVYRGEILPLETARVLKLGLAIP